MTRLTPTQVAQCGFTRLELIAVLAMVTLGYLLLLPALARTKTDSRAFQCLNNSRELARAWRMYCDDSQDRLPYSAERPDQPASSQFAWVTSSLDFSPGNPDFDPVQDIKRSLLSKYSGTNLVIWRCPADTAMLYHNGTNFPRPRSYSMNMYLGGWAYTDGDMGGRALGNCLPRPVNSDRCNPRDYLSWWTSVKAASTTAISL
jgi:type II secretory pathway pseudopilin PulG